MAQPRRAGVRRVRLRRGAIRAEYDRAAIFEVLDAGLIAHVGVTTEQGPIVLPMAYGRTKNGSTCTARSPTPHFGRRSATTSASR